MGSVSGYEAEGLAAGLPESDGLGLAGADGLELEPESVGALLGALVGAVDGAAVGSETGDGVGVALGPHAAMEAAMAMIARSRFTMDLLGRGDGKPEPRTPGAAAARGCGHRAPAGLKGTRHASAGWLASA